MLYGLIVWYYTCCHVHFIETSLTFSSRCRRKQTRTQQRRHKANWANINCHVAAGDWFHLKQICGLVCICCLSVSHLVLIGVIGIGTYEWLCIYSANRRRTAGEWRETFASVLVKSFNRSWTRDFLRFHLFFIFFQTIQHVKHVLTRKIICMSQNVILTTLVYTSCSSNLFSFYYPLNMCDLPYYNTYTQYFGYLLLYMCALSLY